MRKPGLCTQNTSLKLWHISPLLFKILKFVNYIGFPMKYCINGGNFVLSLLSIKSFNFQIYKCGQILCGHDYKPYFLMPGQVSLNMFS